MSFYHDGLHRNDDDVIFSSDMRQNISSLFWRGGMGADETFSPLIFGHQYSEFGENNLCQHWFRSLGLMSSI